MYTPELNPTRSPTKLPKNTQYHHPEIPKSTQKLSDTNDLYELHELYELTKMTFRSLKYQVK